MFFIILFTDQSPIDARDTINNNSYKFSPQSFQFKHKIGFADWDDVNNTSVDYLWFFNLAL